MNAWSFRDEDASTSSVPSATSKTVAKAGRTRARSNVDESEVVGSEVGFPNFAHLSIEEIKSLNGRGVTHTSFAGGAWKITCAAGNELFLEHYAKAVVSDWLRRFHPVNNVRLMNGLAECLKVQQRQLNPDLHDFDDHSRDSISTLPLLPSSQNDMFGGNEFAPDMEDANSMPAWSATTHHSSTSSSPPVGFGSSSNRLYQSSSAVPAPRLSRSVSDQTTFGPPPSYLSLGEIASPRCFRLFFDLDTFWACDQLNDDDLALISIIFQVIQASVRLFFPNVSEEEWERMGTIVGKRTELRPEPSNTIEYNVAWEQGLSRILAAKNAPSDMYAVAIKEARINGTSRTSSFVHNDDAASVVSAASRLTHSSLWHSETSSSPSSSSSSAASSNSFEALIQDVLRTNPSALPSTSNNTADVHNLLAQYSAPYNRPGAGSGSGAGGPRTGRSSSSSYATAAASKAKPHCAGDLSDFYADSPATVAAAEAQLLKNKVFMPYKLGMNAHFPNIRVTAEQAKLMREYVVIQLVTNVICRNDLLQNCRLLAFGKRLVKLTEHRLASTLVFWSNQVVDYQVYGVGVKMPNCRLIFSRKISKCRQCADYNFDASKKRMASGVHKGKGDEACPTCNGTGKADEGPDAVAHGMFAIKGNGLVHNRIIENCIDVSKNPRRTATFQALQSRPIKIGNFAKTPINSPNQSCFTIDTVWTPCVRWLPKEAQNVHVLTRQWVNLTTIRYVPNVTLANGDAPPECLTQGFVIPPCWCHLFDETLISGKSWCNQQLNEHIKKGYQGTVDYTTLADPTVSKMHHIAQSSARERLSLIRSSETSHGHTVAHDTLDSVLQFKKQSGELAMESISGMTKSSLRAAAPKRKVGLKSFHIANQLQNLIRDSQPGTWDRLNFDIPTLDLKPWRLDDTLPKAQLRPHLFDHYSPEEMAAIRYNGMCWTMTCSGASVHNCLIKGSAHGSSCIHFRVTPTHVFQLCYSRKPQNMCWKKFVIVCQVPPALSRLLFDTI